MSLGKKRVLITGSSGLIASEFIKRYKTTFQILAISRKQLKIDQVETFSYCLKDFNKLECKVLEFQPNIVVNTAFYLSSKEDYDEIEQFSQSLLFANKLLKVASSIKNIHWIETRSFSEFEFFDDISPKESPKYLYSVYKKFTSDIVKWYSKTSPSFFCTELILFTVYGKKSKNKKVVDYLIDALDGNTTIELSSGNQRLDFVHIDDVLTAIASSIVLREDRIWVGTGTDLSIRQLAEIILRSSKSDKLSVNWNPDKDRLNDIYFAKAPIKLNSNWSAKVDLETGISNYLKIFNQQ